MKIEKTVPFKQTKPYGCGHYSLANLYNEEKYLDEIVAGRGEKLYHLSESLAKYESHMTIESYFLCNSQIKIQNRFIDKSLFAFADLKEEAKNMCRPFLFTVVGSTLNHCILVLHDMWNDDFYVVDSLHDYVQVYKADELLEAYYVVGVSTFLFKDNPDECLIFFKQYLTHILPSSAIPESQAA